MRNGMCDSLLSGAVQKNETAATALRPLASRTFIGAIKLNPSCLAGEWWASPWKNKHTFTRQRTGGGASPLSFPASGNKLKSFLSRDDRDGVALVQMKLKGDHFSRVSLKQEYFVCVIG